MFDRRGHNRPPFRPKLPGTDSPSLDVPMAVIYRPARSVTQSGPRPRHWILEFEPVRAPEIDPLMGWTSTCDPYRPIRLSFPDCERAVDYAERQDWDYVVLNAERQVKRRAPEPIFRQSGRVNGPSRHGRSPAPGARNEARRVAGGTGRGREGAGRNDRTVRPGPATGRDPVRDPRAPAAGAAACRSDRSPHEAEGRLAAGRDAGR